MKHLGILAHSMEGALLCLRSFCHESFRELGPHQHPDVTLHGTALAHSMEAWEASDHARIRQTLSEGIARLARSGADFFVCPDNTAHMALEAAGESLDLPGLHIAEVVADKAALRGYVRVGILGTKYTMGGPLYSRALGARGIAAEVPEPADRLVVDDIIFRELCNGIFSEPSRREYVRVIEEMQARGCDAVALACTEIPLLVSPGVSPLPTLDSTRLLAGAAFAVCAGRRPMPDWRGGPVGS